VIHLPETGFGSDHQEGHGYKSLSQDHSSGGERRGEARDPAQVLADEAPPTKGEEQCHPAYNGRQNHRQHDQRADHATPAKGDPGENPSQGHAQDHGYQ
jgi:hypothetical protein